MKNIYSLLLLFFLFVRPAFGQDNAVFQLQSLRSSDNLDTIH